MRTVISSDPCVAFVVETIEGEEYKYEFPSVVAAGNWLADMRRVAPRAEYRMEHAECVSEQARR